MKARIYIEDISYLSDEDAFKERYEALPDYRKEEVEAMLFSRDKQLSVGAWALLEKALKEEGIDSVPELEFNDHGKPYLKDGGMFFNLSHSEEKVMCIISDGECGCDIEKIHAVREGLTDRFFSASEDDFVSREEDSLRAFFRIWTMKESYIKAKGTGLSEGLSSFSVIDGISGYEFHEIEFSDGYAASCCVKEGCIIEGIN